MTPYKFQEYYFKTCCSYQKWLALAQENIYIDTSIILKVLAAIADELDHKHFQGPAATCRVRDSKLGSSNNEYMIESVLNHLPIRSHEWECVASEHDNKFADKE